MPHTLYEQAIRKTLRIIYYPTSDFQSLLTRYIFESKSVSNEVQEEILSINPKANQTQLFKKMVKLFMAIPMGREDLRQLELLHMLKNSGNLKWRPVKFDGEIFDTAGEEKGDEKEKVTTEPTTSKPKRKCAQKSAAKAAAASKPKNKKSKPLPPNSELCKQLDFFWAKQEYNFTELLARELCWYRLERKSNGHVNYFISNWKKKVILFKISNSESTDLDFCRNLNLGVDENVFNGAFQHQDGNSNNRSLNATNASYITMSNCDITMASLDQNLTSFFNNVNATGLGIGNLNISSASNLTAPDSEQTNPKKRKPLKANLFQKCNQLTIKLPDLYPEDKDTPFTVKLSTNKENLWECLKDRENQNLIINENIFTKKSAIVRQNKRITGEHRKVVLRKKDYQTQED